jgi:hypothetical protein
VAQPGFRVPCQGKEEILVVDKVLQFLENLKGYLSAGVFTPQYELFESMTDISGTHFEFNYFNERRKMKLSKRNSKWIR